MTHLDVLKYFVPDIKIVNNIEKGILLEIEK